MLADRVHSTAIQLLRRLRKQDDASGLSAARLSALSVIVFGGPATIGQLATAEQVSAPSMTRLLVAMEGAGLVSRARDAGDQRVVWIRPTVRGRRLLHEGRRRRVSVLATAMATLSRADREVLSRAVEVLQRVAAQVPTAVRA